MSEPQPNPALPRQPRPEWAEVMAALMGLRLAIWDELMRGGASDLAALRARLAGDGARAEALGPEFDQAVQWLAERRLLARQDHEWRAVMPALARVQVEMNGLAVVGVTPLWLQAVQREELKAMAQQAPEADEPDAERGRRAVHAHQIEFFSNAGYREANGSL